MTTILIENPKPGRYPRIIVDNNIFRRHYTQSNTHGVTIRWRCISVDKTKCQAVLYGTLQEGTLIKSLYLHNHKDNASKWDKLPMIPKKFPIVRSVQKCKRGPLQSPVFANRELAAKKPNGAKRAKKISTKKADAKPKNSSDPIIFHVEGQAQPIVVQVMDKMEVKEESHGPSTENY